MREIKYGIITCFLKLQIVIKLNNNKATNHNKMSINGTMPQPDHLTQQNLIPIYLLQDKLQQNFKKINKFMETTNYRHNFVTAEISEMKNQQQAIRANFQKKMLEMEKKIVYEISMELEGRIAIAIGKSIENFAQKIQKKERNMGSMREQFEKKLAEMKQELKYEIAMQNQKSFIKQIKKVEQMIKKSSASPSKIQSYSKPVQKQKKLKEEEKEKVKQESQQPEQQTQKQDSPDSSPDWQQQHHQLIALQSRIKSLQQFSINVDKRVYNGMTSLKDSWKQLGTQLLENKKNLSKKMDELRVQFLKLKGLKQFSIGPEKIQDQFRRKLLQKFTDIYQLLSITVTKNEYEATSQRINAKIVRHDDEFIQIRKQLATNNQFFTFYANNSDQDDIRQQLDNLKEQLSQEKKQLDRNLQGMREKTRGNLENIGEIQGRIKKMQSQFLEKTKTIDSVNELVSTVKDRIENLQDFNRFGPDKLEKIHNALDVDFTATQRQLIESKSKKQNLNTVEQSQRQMRIQLSKLKDELFLVSSQNQLKDDELTQMKKNYKQLQSKIQKFRGQSQQALASRKPWVCLSCDRQQKQRDQIKKQTKIKKPEPFKGFGQQKSEKNLKAPPMTPPFQQRFEVYEKLRQKYLSDTIKLPQILKQKLKDKDTSLQN